MQPRKPTLAEIGRGAYSLSEASRYTEVPVGTVRAWFKIRSDERGRGPVFVSDYREVDGSYVVSFLDLIDAYVVGRFRRAGVSMPVVRDAYSVLATELATAHPFAHARLFTDGKRVILGAARQLEDEILYDVLSRQLFFPQLRDRLEHIEYRPDTHLAARWRIAPGVVIDPNVSFGKPVIGGTGTQTAVIARLYRANCNDAGLVGDLFGISETDVAKAVEFETRLAGSIAA